MPMIHDFETRANEIANAYWAKRAEPGGSVIVDGRLHHSDECQALWDELGTLASDATDANRRWAADHGVPERLLFLVGPNAPTVEVQAFRFRAPFAGDAYDLDQMISRLSFQQLDAAGKGWPHTAVWFSHEHRVVITYCEGDTDIEHVFTADRFSARLREIAAWYREHL